MHSPRTLYNVIKHIYTYSDKDIWINFFVSSRVNIRLPQNVKVQINQRTKYPKDGIVRLNIFSENEVTFNLRIRIPLWADSNMIKMKLNGQNVTAKRTKGCLIISRKWSTKDQVEIKFPISMRVETDILGTHEGSGSQVRVDGRLINAKRIGVFWGPLLLTVFRTGHGNDLTWVYRGGYNEILDSGGMTGSDRSCPDYISLDNYAYNVDQKQRGWGVHDSEEIIQVTTRSDCVELQWKHALVDALEKTGEIQYRVKVFPGLPVRLQYRQKVLIKASAGNPKVVSEMFLSGIRFSTRQEQYHDAYKRIWRYEYPPVKVSINGKAFFYPKDGQEIKNMGKYYLDNGIFRVECRYEGDVEKVVAIKRERWTGIYLSPLRKNSLKLNKDTIFVIRKDLTFHFKSYAESTCMSEEWTDDLMTQPIHTL